MIIKHQIILEIEYSISCFNKCCALCIVKCCLSSEGILQHASQLHLRYSTYCSRNHKEFVLQMRNSHGFLLIHFAIFIRPRSDHSLRLSVTDSLTHRLTNLLKLDVTALLKLNELTLTQSNLDTYVGKYAEYADIFHKTSLWKI